MWKSTLGIFRGIGIIEGISFLVLLGIAMPLKYFADMPIYVTVVGMAHGVLFVAYCVMLLAVWVRYRWSFWRVVGAFVASLLPFGTFVLEARLRKVVLNS